MYTLREIFKQQDMYIGSGRAIWVRLLNGETLEEVGEDFDVGPTRVGQLFVKVRRIVRLALHHSNQGIGAKWLPELDKDLIDSAFLIDLRPKAKQLIALFDDLAAIEALPESESSPELSPHFPNINPHGGRKPQECQSCGNDFQSNFHESQLCYMCYRGLVELRAVLQSFPEE